MNPLLVRELRQLVRNRFIIVMLIMYLVLLSIISTVIVTSGTTYRTEEQLGIVVFQSISWTMGFLSILIVCTYTGLMTALERINNDLMFTSALKPSRIIRGKFLSGMSLSIMLFSVTLPFLTLAYLLRGIDPMEAMFHYLVLFLCVHLFNAFVILVFSALRTHVQLIFCAGVCLIGFFIFYFRILSWFFGYIVPTLEGVIPEATLCLLFFSISLILLLLTIATVNISPPTTNRMVPFRIAITAWFVLSFLFTVFFQISGFDFWKIWLVFQVAMLCAIIVIVVSERDSLGRRLLSTIPKNPFLRLLVLPFYTGSMSGLVWFFLLAVMLFAALYCFDEPQAIAILSYNMTPDRSVMIGIIMILFTYDYSMSAMLLRKAFFKDSLGSEKTSALLLAMVPVISLGSMLLCYLMSSTISTDFFLSEYNDSVLSAVNPFVFLFDSGNQFDYNRQFYFSLIWGALVTLLAAPWFFMQLYAFSPNTNRDL